MVGSAIRLGLDDYGNFKGLMANEMKRRYQGKKELEYHAISEWNNFFLQLDPSSERWMWFWGESMPKHETEDLVK